MRSLFRLFFTYFIYILLSNVVFSAIFALKRFKRQKNSTILVGNVYFLPNNQKIVKNHGKQSYYLRKKFIVFFYYFILPKNCAKFLHDFIWVRKNCQQFFSQFFSKSKKSLNDA